MVWHQMDSRLTDVSIYVQEHTWKCTDNQNTITKDPEQLMHCYSIYVTTILII